MEFAPVIIPTLNRYEHFRNCLESLESCKYSDKTDVYVALDFPPSQKYIEGWERIDNYLHDKESNNSFKSLTVFRRKENYYFSGKGNASSAIKELLNVYDRYIFSEDDNVFSSRFLEDINVGLEKYRDVHDIFAICGYCHPYDFDKNKYDGNCVRLQEMSAWGYGTWVDRLYSKETKKKLIQDYVNDVDLRWHFTKRRADIYTGLLYMKSRNVIWGDCFYTADLYKTNRYCLFPLLSLVQNHGWDGTGTHGGMVEGFSTQAIEGMREEKFVFKVVNEEETKEIDKYVVAYWRKRTSTTHHILNFLMIKIFSLTGRIVTFDSLTKKAKHIRSWWYSKNRKK